MPFCQNTTFYAILSEYDILCYFFKIQRSMLFFSEYNIFCYFSSFKSSFRFLNLKKYMFIKIFVINSHVSLCLCKSLVLHRRTKYTYIPINYCNTIYPIYFYCLTVVNFPHCVGVITTFKKQNFFKVVSTIYFNFHCTKFDCTIYQTKLETSNIKLFKNYYEKIYILVMQTFVIYLCIFAVFFSSLLIQ